MASTTEEARVLELFVLQSSEGPCLECYHSGLPQVNFDPREVETRWPNYQAAIVEAGYLSTHALPMKLRGEVIGVLNLFCHDQVSLSDDEIALGQALCDIATIGLLQERAVRQSEILAEQLQSALNSRILIEQAKGVLAERAGIDVDEAFAQIRNWARTHHLHLQAAAQAVIDGTSDLNQAETG
jgi:GAF domain-containing protein